MILGIDQGTTGSTAVILTSKGKLKGKHTAALPQHFPQPGWIEHDPQAIWRSVGAAVSGVLTKTKCRADKIKVIGLTNQRETVSLFEGKKPLHRFIVWQDRRTAEACEKLKLKAGTSITAKTGLPIDPYFSSSKIHWLLKKLKPSKKRDIRFRTIDSFLIQQMTGEDATEITNAHRTQLLNLKSGTWDQNLFDLFDVPRSTAPELLPSEGTPLKTKALDFLPAGIPIRAILGDQQAALFGQIGWKKGAGKITYGTGSFILVNTGQLPILSKHGLSGTIALQWKGGEKVYALEGSSFICGAWIQWLRDELKMIKEASDSEKLARKVKDSGGVFIIPALSGMGAPFWRSDLRGEISGLTRGTSRSHIARASLEALCYQNRALIEAIEKDTPNLKYEWKVDGGASENNLLMQIQADSIQQDIIRPKSQEATAVGVALLAAHSEGMLSLKQIEALWKLDRTFIAEKRQAEYHDQHYQQWLRRVNSSLVV